MRIVDPLPGYGFDRTSTFTTNPHEIMTDRVVIAMVGLPARGKSYISKAIILSSAFSLCRINSEISVSIELLDSDDAL